jgi:cobalt-zinc-cadmium efflux system protein
LSEPRGHNNSSSESTSGRPARRLVAAVSVTAVILVGEVVGGIWSGSLALISDAAHVFMDVFALALSLAALLLARRPADERRTYGWHRAEVFAALINGGTLIAVAAFIFVEGIRRLLEPTPVKGVGLLIIAVVGLVANGAVALLLRRHATSDINIRGAFLHVLGDALASIAVVVGALVVIATGWYYVDPILALGIGALLFWGAGRLVRDAARILFEGTPPGVKPAEIAEALTAVEGVTSVHDLHVWALCSHVTNLSAHLVVCEGTGDETRRAAEGVLAERFKIRHTTLQLETEPCTPQPEDVFCEKLSH